MKDMEVFFKDVNVRVVEVDGTKMVNASDVARAIGYKNPRKASSEFILSNGELLGKGVRQIRTPTAGGEQESWFFTLEGVTAFLIKTSQPSALEFQKWAVATLAKAITDRATGEYKTIRAKSKKIRNGFTDTLQDHGIRKPVEFIEITYATKRSLGIEHTKPKDELDLWELCQVSIAETLSTYSLAKSDANGLVEVAPIVKKASKTVAQIQNPALE